MWHVYMSTAYSVHVCIECKPSRSVSMTYRYIYVWIHTLYMYLQVHTPVYLSALQYRLKLTTAKYCVDWFCNGCHMKISCFWQWLRIQTKTKTTYLRLNISFCLFATPQVWVRNLTHSCSKVTQVMICSSRHLWSVRVRLLLPGLPTKSTMQRTYTRSESRPWS